MNPQLAQESMTVMYFEGKPEFIIQQNGKLNWFRLVPATQDDLKSLFNAKTA